MQMKCRNGLHKSLTTRFTCVAMSASNVSRFSVGAAAESHKLIVTAILRQAC